MAPPPEVMNILITLVGLGGVALAAIFVLRFQYFDKEMKELRKQVLSKSSQIDTALDAEIMKAPKHDKKLIKRLVSRISGYESTAKEIEDMRSRMVSNFKFDFVSFALLGMILVLGQFIAPLELAYFPMFGIAMLVGFHFMNFGGTVFAYLKVRKEMEDEEESERQGVTVT